MYKKYGKIIRDIRTEKGMSIEELSDRCLIPAETLQRVENGEEPLQEAELTLAANALDISAVALASGELVRREEMPRLEDLIGRIEKRIEELEINMAYMQEIVKEFAYSANSDYLDLDSLEERLLSNIDEPYNAEEKEKVYVR